MNPRLIAYLRSLGLSREATTEEADAFFRNLRGTQAVIANLLNHDENDQRAAGACDVAIRAMGFDPLNPINELTPTGEGDDGSGNDGDSSDGTPDLDAIRRQGAEAEGARRSAITRIATIAGTPEEFLRGLLDDPQVTVEAASARIGEEHRQRTRASDVTPDLPAGAPAQHNRDSVTGVTERTLRAAQMIRNGLDPVERWIDVDRNSGVVTIRRNYQAVERDADAAYEFRDLSIEDQMRQAARIDGVNLPRGRQGLMEAYCRSMSTAALQAIFTQNMSAQLIEAYEGAPDSTDVPGLVRVNGQVPDFKTNERPRMLKGERLQKLPRGGKAEDATYEDTAESYKIARYARKFQVDDQDVIDDSFGAMAEHTPAEMGEAAREVRPDLYYSILLANANMADGTPLFDASRNNLLGTNPLNGDNLKKSRAQMRVLTESGRNLNLMFGFLIVPPILEDDSDVLINSRFLVSTDTARTPQNNPNAGRGIIIVADARLENGVTDPRDGSGGTTYAGSQTNWFGSARGQRPIEIGYLRGTNQLPQIRSYVLNQGAWGIGWDVKIDIGAKELKALALQKNTA